MSVHDLLMPDGVLIRTAGSSPEIREMPGNVADAEEFFLELVKEGTPDTTTTHPRLFRVPEGTFGFRDVSKRNGPPTIDVNVPGIPIIKIKFTG